MMTDLQKRLDESGYTRELEQQEKDKQLIAAIKRDLRIQGKPPTPELLNFEKEVNDFEAADIAFAAFRFI